MKAPYEFMAGGLEVLSGCSILWSGFSRLGLQVGLGLVEAPLGLGLAKWWVSGWYEGVSR